MKIEPVVKIASEKSRFEVYPDGSEAAAFFSGGRQLLSIRRIRTGKFDEALGLVEKLRRHLANDALSAEVDSANVIPFGCEYHVRRHWKMAADVVELTDDIAADNGGKISDLFLEEVVFTGEAEKVEILLDGESAMQSFAPEGVICDTEKLILLVKVTFRDGLAAEFYSGDDFFRHNAAAGIAGAAARHTVSVQNDGIHWVRHILAMEDETLAEKRPWRFKSLFAAGSSDVSAASAAEKVELSGCFAAPALHREFRTFVRKSPAADIQLQVSGSIMCTDGSHISRPGKSVAHGMLGAIFDDFTWAAGVTAKRGGTFTADIQLAEAANSQICANLRRPAGEMEFVEAEDFE